MSQSFRDTALQPAKRQKQTSLHPGKEDVRITSWFTNVLYHTDSDSSENAVTELRLEMSFPVDWMRQSPTIVQRTVMRYIFGAAFWKNFVNMALQTPDGPLRNMRLRLAMALKTKDAEIVTIIRQNSTKDECNVKVIIHSDASYYKTIERFFPQKTLQEKADELLETPSSELQTIQIDKLVFLVERTETETGNYIKIWGLINKKEDPELQYAACLLIECETEAQDKTQWTLTSFFYNRPAWYFDLAKKRKRASRTLAGIAMQVVKVTLRDGESIHVGDDAWHSRMGKYLTDVTSETLKNTAKDILHYEYVEKRYKQLYPNKRVPRAVYLNQTAKDGFYAPWLHGNTKKEDFRITNADFTSKNIGRKKTPRQWHRLEARSQAQALAPA